MKCWGKLFGMHLVLGGVTGLTMAFQFGANLSYSSHDVGGIFDAPLVLAGLMVFFLKSTLVGLFFFGWDRLSKAKYLTVTWLEAFALNMLALWILIPNGWMQNLVGSEFNYETMWMQLGDFSALLFHLVVHAKFVHAVSARIILPGDKWGEVQNVQLAAVDAE